jgi:hypothetical protein
LVILILITYLCEDQVSNSVDVPQTSTESKRWDTG